MKAPLLKILKPRERLYFIKVDQPGTTLYVHPLGQDGYQVLDGKEGAALWRGEHEGIMFIKQIEKINPGRKFKLEVLEEVEACRSGAEGIL